MKRLWKDQRGQSMAFYAGAILVIILVVGMVIEVGWWSFSYYKAQNAADLAALSAAQYVPLSQADENYRYGSTASRTKMVQVGQSVFWQNDGYSGSVEVDPHRKGKQIACCNWAVVEHRDHHSWLLIDEIMEGLGSYFTIHVKAYGKAEALYEPTEVVPLGVLKRATYEMVFDTSMVLTGNLADPTLGTSNLRLGILDMTKNGTMSGSNALDWLTNNYTGQQGMKVAYETTGWNKTLRTQEVADALNKRVEKGEKVMLLPVVDPQVLDNGEVKIHGFAAFELSSAQVAGNGELSINGKFIKYVDSGSDRRPNDATNNAWYFGVRVVYLDNSVPK